MRQFAFAWKIFRLDSHHHSPRRYRMLRVSGGAGDVVQSPDAVDPCRSITARGDDALAVRGERGADDLRQYGLPALPAAAPWPRSRPVPCPSQLAVTIRWPSGENAALTTASVWPSSSATCCPVAAFQTRAVPSSLAVTMRWPSGENAALLTESVWPSSFASCCPVAAFQTRAVLSCSR